MSSKLISTLSNFDHSLERYLKDKTKGAEAVFQTAAEVHKLLVTPGFHATILRQPASHVPLSRSIKGILGRINTHIGSIPIDVGNGQKVDVLSELVDLNNKSLLPRWVLKKFEQLLTALDASQGQSIERIKAAADALTKFIADHEKELDFSIATDEELSKLVQLYGHCSENNHEMVGDDRVVKNQDLKKALQTSAFLFQPIDDEIQKRHQGREKDWLEKMNQPIPEHDFDYFLMHAETTPPPEVMPDFSLCDREILQHYQKSLKTIMENQPRLADKLNPIYEEVMRCEQLPKMPLEENRLNEFENCLKKALGGNLHIHRIKKYRFSNDVNALLENLNKLFSTEAPIADIEKLLKKSYRVEIQKHSLQIALNEPKFFHIYIQYVDKTQFSLNDFYKSIPASKKSQCYAVGCDVKMSPKQSMLRQIVIQKIENLKKLAPGQEQPSEEVITTLMGHEALKMAELYRRSPSLIYFVNRVEGQNLKIRENEHQLDSAQFNQLLNELRALERIS